ncbi:MAG: hypothetical protein ACK2UX_14910 [Anaerolineae bacterium]
MSSQPLPHTSCSVTDAVPASPVQRAIGLLGLLEGAPRRECLGRVVAETLQSLVPRTDEVETLLQECDAPAKEKEVARRDRET